MFNTIANPALSCSLLSCDLLSPLKCFTSCFPLLPPVLYSCWRGSLSGDRDAAAQVSNCSGTQLIKMYPTNPKNPNKNLKKPKKQPPQKVIPRQSVLFSHMSLLPSSNAIQHNIYTIKYWIFSVFPACLWFCCASCFRTVLLHEQGNPVGCPGSWLRGTADCWVFPVKIPCIGNPELLFHLWLWGWHFTNLASNQTQRWSRECDPECFSLCFLPGTSQN